MKVAADDLKTGAIFEHERVITLDDVRDFARVSRDHGRHHGGQEPMAHGLLVTSIITKIGGDMDFVSRYMDMEFLAPVYAGDSVRGRVVLEKVLRRGTRIKIWMRCECFRGDGTMVIRGSGRGQVPLTSNT